MRRTLLALTALLVLSMTAVPLRALDGPIDPVDDPVMHPIGFHRGLLPTPANGEDLGELYGEVSAYTQFVPVWGRPSPFYNLTQDLDGPWGDLFVEQFIRGNGMFPLVHMTFIGEGLTLATPPTLPGATLNDTQWRAEYRKAALGVVNASRPAYLSLGNEVNRWYEAYGTDPSDDNGFQHWVSLYESVYDDVKALSPDTTVFCTFAREIVAELREADMSVLEMFNHSKLDLLVLTSYPHSVSGINKVSDIPDDYYLEVFDHIPDMPLGFSEIAWPSFSGFGGEAGQAQFVSDAVNRLTADQGLDLHLIGWSWLTDLAQDDRVGLRYLNGTAKLGLEAWKMNGAPYIEPEARTIILPEDFGSYDHDLGRTFKDPDLWDSLMYEIRNETGEWGKNRSSTLLDAFVVNSSLRLLSHPDMTGTTQLMVRATDHDGLSVWTLLEVKVLPVNDAPRTIVPFGPQTILEDHSKYIALSYHMADPDDEFEELEIEVLSSPDLSYTLSNPYLIVFTREPDWFGTTFMELSLTDPSGLTLVENITFEVTPENDPPAPDLASYYEIAEDGVLVIDLSDKWTDVDDDEVQWGFNTSEENVTIMLDGDVVTIAPSPDWHGPAVIYANLSDGRLHVVQAISLNVLEVNDPPRLGPSRNITMDEDNVLYFDLGSLGAHDPEGTQLSWSVIDVPAIFRSVSVLDNGTMRIAPQTDRYGNGSIGAEVRDAEGGRTDVDLQVTILPVNDAPFLSIRANTTFTVDEGSFILLDLQELPFTMYDVETPNEGLDILVEGAEVTVSGTVLNLSVPEGSVAQTVQFDVRVTDPDGGSSDPVRIVVKVRPIDHTVVYRVNITSLEYDNIDGMVVITVVGEPYQSIHVVFSDGSSFRAQETPPGNGKYILELSEPPWTDGTLLSFHLSAQANGPNDTQFLPWSMTYMEAEEVTEEGAPTYLYILAIVLGVMLFGAVLLILLRKKQGPVTDYRSLVEE